MKNILKIIDKIENFDFENFLPNNSIIILEKFLKDFKEEKISKEDILSAMLHKIIKNLHHHEGVGATTIFNIENFLKMGADPRFSNVEDEPILSLAISTANMEIIEIFVKHALYNKDHIKPEYLTEEVANNIKFQLNLRFCKDEDKLYIINNCLKYYYNEEEVKELAGDCCMSIIY